MFPASEAYACPPGDWACVAREIQSFGSVAVTFGSVRADFYEHRTGVYRVRDVSDPGLGQHATKLIGWGFDEDEDGREDDTAHEKCARFVSLIPFIHDLKHFKDLPDIFCDCQQFLDLGGGVFVCGDWCAGGGSVDRALVSGASCARRVAELLSGEADAPPS